MLPLLVTIEEPEAPTPTRYRFTSSPVRLGRNMLNDLPIDNGFVSQWHAIIRFDERNTYYFDLGSTNGTFMGGRRVDKNVPIPLIGETSLRIGSVKITATRGEGSPSVLAEATGRGAAPQAGPSPDFLRPLAPTVLAIDGRPPPGPAGPPPAPVVEARPSPPKGPEPTPPTDAAGASQTLSFFGGRGGGGAGATPAPARPPAAKGTVVAGVLGPGLPSPPRAPDSSSGERREGREGAAPAVTEALERFARERFGSGARPADPLHLLDSMFKVLDGLSASFIGLRNGFVQFGNQVGVRTIAGRTPLHRSTTGGEILAYLLEPGGDTIGRVQELKGIFADLGIHHVALMEGISEGVKQLLARLDPSGYDPEAGAGLLRRRDRSRWKEYLEEYAAVRDDERERHDAVFGSEFARAYASVTMSSDSGSGSRDDGT